MSSLPGDIAFSKVSRQSAMWMNIMLWSASWYVRAGFLGTYLQIAAMSSSSFLRAGSDSVLLISVSLSA
jgi:hypothetical protein